MYSYIIIIFIYNYNLVSVYSIILYHGRVEIKVDMFNNSILFRIKDNNRLNTLSHLIL